VTGVDLAPDLVSVARRRGGRARFAVGDLSALPLRAVYGAALCRGVLKDVLDDDGRRAVMTALAGVLAERGVLVLDVRDWDATVRRKTVEPVHERTVETEQGTLTFRSETRLDPATRRLLVSERHVLVTRSGTESEAYEFVMRCWTRGELDARLREAGLVLVELRGAYDDAIPAGATDRLVAIAAAARRVC
jgi:SAM-dependent methyltransferase